VTGRERNFSFHLEVETTLLTSRFSTNATRVVFKPTPKSAFLETTRMTSLTSLPFADITLGVLNDYAQYKSTHSLTHSLIYRLPCLYVGQSKPVITKIGYLLLWEYEISVKINVNTRTFSGKCAMH